MARVYFLFALILILGTVVMLPCSSAVHLHAEGKYGSCFAGDELVSYEAVTEENVLELRVPTGYEGKSARSQTEGFRIEMVHRDSVQPEGNEIITSTERLRRAVERSKGRQQMFLSKTTPRSARGTVRAVEAPVHAGNGEFLMQIGIGSPALTYNAIVDTGSDLIWTQCKPCRKCYQQPGQIYDPSKSRTFSKVPCDSTFCQALPESYCSPDCQYAYQYGDSSFTTGILAFDTFTLETAATLSKMTGSVPLSHLAFGCGHDNEGGGFTQGGGLVGLGRGPLSLISQLGNKVSNKFSYCLVSMDDPASKTSPLLFGDSADLHGRGIKSTPLVRSDSQPTFYYLQLEGISVHGSRLDLPQGTFDLNADGSGGFIIDSGTTITYLPNDAYSTLKSAVQQNINLRPADGSATGLDDCYTLPPHTSKITVPTITFHFAGGADFVLPAANAFIADEESGLLCLAMGGSSGPSIFGNIQQQNFHILYDLGMNKLSFVPARCDTL